MIFRHAIDEVVKALMSWFSQSPDGADLAAKETDALASVADGAVVV